MGFKELRDLALAYDKALASHEKALERDEALIKDIRATLQTFFAVMDPHEKYSVAFKEFSICMETLKLPQLCSDEFFSKLKADEKSDNLTETDVVTLFYILYSRLPFCNGQCKKLIEGTSYWICVNCYLDDHKIDNEESFNLCTSCFNDEKYEHDKGHRFLDENLLLQHLRKNYVKNRSNEPVADSSTPSATIHGVVDQDHGQNTQMVTESSADSATEPTVADNSPKPSADQLEAGSSSQSANQNLTETSTQLVNEQALVVFRRPHNYVNIGKVFHTIMTLVSTGISAAAAFGCSIM